MTATTFCVSDILLYALRVLCLSFAPKPTGWIHHCYHRYHSSTGRLRHGAWKLLAEAQTDGQWKPQNSKADRQEGFSASFLSLLWGCYLHAQEFLAPVLPGSSTALR